jgi:hypothetical protein
VVGAIAFLVLCFLAIFVFRRKKAQKTQKERPVDLLDDEGDENDDGRDDGRLPQYYQPEPFIVPDPISTPTGSIHGTDDGGAQLGVSGGRPISGSATSRSGTPDLLTAAGSSTAATRKSGLRVMRPVNIIQHDDAGPNEDPKNEEEPETIELPPAYTNIRK